MKMKALVLSTCAMAGCISMPRIAHVHHPEWSTSIATDHIYGDEPKSLELNDLLMSWSTSSPGEGWLYLTHPRTQDHVWTFPDCDPPEEDSVAVKVSDGNCFTAVHKSGRRFEIEVVIQTYNFAMVKYKESNQRIHQSPDGDW